MVAWIALALAVLADLLLVCLAFGVLWAGRKAKPYMAMFAPPKTTGAAYPPKR